MAGSCWFDAKEICVCVCVLVCARVLCKFDQMAQATVLFSLLWTQGHYSEKWRSLETDFLCRVLVLLKVFQISLEELDRNDCTDCLHGIKQVRGRRSGKELWKTSCGQNEFEIFY